MRKLLSFVAAMFITGSVLAGGLVTNTNHSAMFTRLQNRNASTGIDAVYYNPAGLTKLGNGFYVSLNNQTIGQTKTVGNNYQFIEGAPKDYVGNVSAPLYPGVYAAFVTGKLAFSAGFNPVGGGGGATYDKGLPSFETMVADLVPLLNSQNFPTSQYSADIFFEGTSVYFGYQGNISYKINDMISVAAGVRYVTAKNTYNGHLRNISVNPTFPVFGATGNMMLASDFFATGATTLNGLALASTSAATGLTTLITGGVPAATPVSALPAATAAGITQILGAAGISTAGMNIGTAAATLNAVAPGFTQNAAVMSGYSTATGDINVDAEQTGSGITPIISVNITPNDKLNIALKYEFQTNLELTTSLAGPALGGGIFTEGAKTIADMPALLAAGVEFRPIEKLMVAASMNMYFDKNVDYDGSESLDINMIDNNFLEYGLGLEYGISEKLRASAGWVATSTGVNDAYQNDQRYSTNTNSFGAGIGYRITPMIDLNLGGQYTFYAEGSKDYNHILGGNPIPVTETYGKKTWIVGLGLDFYFGK